VFNIGPLELIVVLIIALIVLGPQRLPEVARSVGRGMREFRNALDREHDDEEDEVADEEEDGDEPHRRLEQRERKPAAYQKDAESRESSSSSSDLV